MSRTGRTPIDDNAVYGDLDKSDREVISGQFLTCSPQDFSLNCAIGEKDKECVCECAATPVCIRLTNRILQYLSLQPRLQRKKSHLPQNPYKLLQKAHAPHRLQKLPR